MPQSTPAVFEFVAKSSRNLLTYALKDKDDHVNYGTLHHKTQLKSFSNGIVHKRLGFEYICTTIFSQNIQLFHKLFTGAFESGGPMRSYNFGNVLPINVLKYHRRKFHLL